MKSFYRSGGFPTITVTGMSFSQSIEAPLTLKDTAVLSGGLSTSNGSGSGSVNLSLRRMTSSAGGAEIQLGCGGGLMLSARGFGNLTKRIFTNISGVITTTDRGFGMELTSSKFIIVFSIPPSLSFEK